MEYSFGQMEESAAKFFECMDAALERADFLGKSLEAMMRGEGVMIRIVDDEITAERVVLFADPPPPNPRRA